MLYSITPQALIEQAENFYGFKAKLNDAIDYLERGNAVSPGNFIDWLSRQKKPSLF